MTNNDTTQAGTQPVGCQTTSFSPLTCDELITSLTPAQIQRELEIILDANVLQSRNTPRKQLLSLKKHFYGQIMTDNDKLTANIYIWTYLSFFEERWGSKQADETAPAQRQHGTEAYLISATELSTTYFWQFQWVWWSSSRYRFSVCCTCRHSTGSFW